MGRPRGTADRTIDGDGYVRVRVDGGRWKFEHRVVAERVLGRKLKRGEKVFHLDDDPANNAPENLGIGRGLTPTTRLVPPASSVHADDCMNGSAPCTVGLCVLREGKRRRDREYQERRRARSKRKATR